MIRDLLRQAAEDIRRIGAGNPSLEADLILSKATGKSRVFFYTHPEYRLDPNEASRFETLLYRRLSGEPLQYVLGTAGFRNLILSVGPGVLIPRPETEVLVDVVLDALSRRREKGIVSSWASSHRPWVVDVGAGSGAIILAIIQEGGNTSDLWFEPLALDISAIALEVTRRNARALGLGLPTLVRSDMLSAVSPEAPLEAIVSNPPYVRTGEIAKLPAEIRDHEPLIALDGGPDGLVAIRRLIEQAAPYVDRGALLCFEFGEDQADAVAREAARLGLPSPRIHQDLAGRPRVAEIDPSGV